MSKAEKSVVSHRVHEVLRLIVAGAEFMDIWRYAQEHAWQISQRQVRRYMGRAHKLFAKSTQKNRKQLLGRHLVQRRSIYARAVKSGDLRTALQALKDEATLQGLYTPAALEEQVTGIAQHHYLPAGEPVAIRRSVRVARLVMAQANNDSAAQRLVEHATPRLVYTMPDTQMPKLVLHTLAGVYVSQQLECVGMVLHSTVTLLHEKPDLPFCARILAVCSYRYKANREGWELFCKEIGVDAEYLVEQNYDGVLLQIADGRMNDLAMTAEELQETFRECGDEVGAVVTAAELAKSWQRMFAKSTREIE